MYIYIYIYVYIHIHICISVYKLQTCVYNNNKKESVRLELISARGLRAADWSLRGATTNE